MRRCIDTYVAHCTYMHTLCLTQQKLLYILLGKEKEGETLSLCCRREVANSRKLLIGNASTIPLNPPWLQPNPSEPCCINRDAEVKKHFRMLFGKSSDLGVGWGGLPQAPAMRFVKRPLPRAALLRLSIVGGGCSTYSPMWG